MKIFLLSFLIIIISCQSKKKEPFIVTENAAQLIAGDTIKRWKLAKRFNNGYRMNMGDCFLSYRVSYSRNLTMKDNNGEYNECGESLEANWQIITDKNGSFIKLNSDQIPRLLNINENYKYLKINELSENKLVLQFKHKQFSNKSTIIIDYLVPENKVVEDRNFHH